MFCVGDIVVYGAQGLCKVDGIGPLPMKFADKSKRYYTLHTCKQPSMTIYAPVDNQTVVMRQPLNRAQAETLISEMPQYAVVPIMDAKITVLTGSRSSFSLFTVIRSVAFSIAILLCF